MTTVEEQAVEKNGLRRAVTVGLMGFILCLGLSYHIRDWAENWADSRHKKAWEEYKEAHPINYDDLLKDAMSKYETSNMSEEETSRMYRDGIKQFHQKALESFSASRDNYMAEVMPGLSKKSNLIEFSLLAGTGLLVALFGLAASAVWTALQSRRLAGGRLGEIFQAVLPHADFNQPLLFSSRNVKELLWWTAGWLAAPLAIAASVAYIMGGYMSPRPLLDDVYPLAVSLGSFYIFSFWLTLAVYARRGRLADPGERSVKFRSRALLCCFFFIYAPLLAAPLDLIVGLIILFSLFRSTSKPPAPDARA